VLSGQVALVIEAVGILKVARPADFRRRFHLLSIRKRKLLILLESDRNPRLGILAQVEGKLLAIRREYGRVGYTPGNKDSFGVVSRKAWRPTLAMDNLCSNSGEQNTAAHGGTSKMGSTGAGQRERQNQHTKSGRYKQIGQVEEIEMCGQNACREGGTRKDQRFAHM
jgi:hypothetical protein